jgi:hypothetical protein
MKFVVNRLLADYPGKLTFSGEVTDDDLAELRLTDFDQALIRDVEGDPTAHAADFLLVLEMLFRRHKEQVKQSHKNEVHIQEQRQHGYS